MTQKAKALHFVSKLTPESKKLTGLTEPKDFGVTEPKGSNQVCQEL